MDFPRFLDPNNTSKEDGIHWTEYSWTAMLTATSSSHPMATVALDDEPPKKRIRSDESLNSMVLSTTSSNSITSIEQQPMKKVNHTILRSKSYQTLQVLHIVYENYMVPSNLSLSMKWKVFRRFWRLLPGIMKLPTSRKDELRMSQEIELKQREELFRKCFSTTISTENHNSYYTPTMTMSNNNDSLHVDEHLKIGKEIFESMSTQFSRTQSTVKTTGNYTAWIQWNIGYGHLLRQQHHQLQHLLHVTSTSSIPFPPIPEFLQHFQYLQGTLSLLELQLHYTCQYMEQELDSLRHQSGSQHRHANNILRLLSSMEYQQELFDQFEDIILFVFHIIDHLDRWNEKLNMFMKEVEQQPSLLMKSLAYLRQADCCPVLELWKLWQQLQVMLFASIPQYSQGHVNPINHRQVLHILALFALQLPSMEIWNQAGKKETVQATFPLSHANPKRIYDRMLNHLMEPSQGMHQMQLQAVSKPNYAPLKGCIQEAMLLRIILYLQSHEVFEIMTFMYNEELTILPLLIYYYGLHENIKTNNAGKMSSTRNTSYEMISLQQCLADQYTATQYCQAHQYLFAQSYRWIALFRAISVYKYDGDTNLVNYPSQLLTLVGTMKPWTRFSTNPLIKPNPRKNIDLPLAIDYYRSAIRATYALFKTKDFNHQDGSHSTKLHQIQCYYSMASCHLYNGNMMQSHYENQKGNVENVEEDDHNKEQCLAYVYRQVSAGFYQQSLMQESEQVEFSLTSSDVIEAKQLLQQHIVSYKRQCYFTLATQIWKLAFLFECKDGCGSGKKCGGAVDSPLEHAHVGEQQQMQALLKLGECLLTSKCVPNEAFHQLFTNNETLPVQFAMRMAEQTNPTSPHAPKNCISTFHKCSSVDILIPQFVHFMILQAFQGIQFTQLLDQLCPLVLTILEAEEIIKISNEALQNMLKIITSYGSWLSSKVPLTCSQISSDCVQSLFYELHVMKCHTFLELWSLQKQKQQQAKVSPTSTTASSPFVNIQAVSNLWMNCIVDDHKLLTMETLAKDITTSAKFDEFIWILKPIVQALPWLRRAWIASFQESKLTAEYNLAFADAMWSSAQLFWKMQSTRHEDQCLITKDMFDGKFQNLLQHSQQHLHRAIYLQEHHQLPLASLAFELGRSYLVLADKQTTYSAHSKVITSLQHAIFCGETLTKQMHTFSKSDIKMIIPETIRMIRSARFIGEVMASMEI